MCSSPGTSRSGLDAAALLKEDCVGEAAIVVLRVVIWEVSAEGGGGNGLKRDALHKKHSPVPK